MLKQYSSNILENQTDNLLWKEWIGLKVFFSCFCFCSVIWDKSEGVENISLSLEFLNYLEVIEAHFIYITSLGWWDKYPKPFIQAATK